MGENGGSATAEPFDLDEFMANAGKLYGFKMLLGNTDNPEIQAQLAVLEGKVAAGREMMQKLAHT